MSSEHEALSAVDAAWLRMESPLRPMTITALLELEPAMPFEDLIRFVEQRLLESPHFTDCLVDPKLPGWLPRWQRDSSFDVRAHVHRVGLPPPGDEKALEELLSDLMSTPLDRSKPLWQIHLVECYGGGSALVARLHHCIGDGVALVRLLLSLVDEGAALASADVGLAPRSAAHGWERMRAAGEQALALARTLALGADPETPLTGDFGTRKCVVWSKPIQLFRVKAVAKALGAKVNDVLTSCVSGALRTYIDTRAAWIEDTEIRALVPMYVRPQQATDLGNHFGLVFLDLPLWLTDRIERVHEMKRRMDVLKQRPDAPMALRVLGAMGVASADIERMAIDIFTRKASVMMTNVPGPPAHVHIVGRKVKNMIMWAPVSGHLGVGLSVLSYAGAVTLGVASDAKIVSDPRVIATAFETEFNALQLACIARRHPRAQQVGAR
jgi:WS/DGAT/MGAT family acyltransferase